MPANQPNIGPEQRSSHVEPRPGIGEWLAPVLAFLTIAALVLASIWIVLGSRI
ncbi:MAG TPA: hypothetical protein VJX16_15425 [Terriglobales bacterium]|nr:hypothetical protein [Terriglobales bacterium]